MDPEIKVAKLKKLDYHELLNTAQQYHEKSEKSADKINKLYKKSKQSKNRTKAIEHKKIWNLESIKLTNQKRKLEREIDNFIASTTYGFNDAKNQITEDHTDFRKSVIEPIFLLCDDIKEWKIKCIQGYKVPESEPIKVVLEEMNAKLRGISVQLQNEMENLTDNLNQEIHEYYSSVTVDNVHDKVGTGIPIDAWEIETPDTEMLSELLSQFIQLDEHYQLKFDKIVEKSNFVSDTISLPPSLKSNEVGDLYSHVFDYYQSNVTVNRLEMILNIMSIIFPQFSQKQLIQMGEWYRTNHLMKDKLQALVADWRRDRSELNTKLRALIMDYNEQLLLNDIELERDRIQKELCSQLNDKVIQWREYKKEFQQLQEAIAQQKEEEERLEAEERLGREMKKRQDTKIKICKYKFEKGRQQQHILEEQRRRFDELQLYLQQQAEVDRERVEYRDSLWHDKMNQQNFARWIKWDQEKQTEMRLARLAESVRPHVESDPERLLLPTAAWLKHTEDNNETDESVMDLSMMSNVGGIGQRFGQPLHTYTDGKIMSDPRVRIEAALRGAGLMQSDYARQMMKTVPTNQAPRKDCDLSKGNFLKYD